MGVKMGYRRTYRPKDKSKIKYKLKITTEYISYRDEEGNQRFKKRTYRSFERVNNSEEG